MGIVISEITRLVLYYDWLASERSLVLDLHMLGAVLNENYAHVVIAAQFPVKIVVFRVIFR